MASTNPQSRKRAVRQVDWSTQSATKGAMPLAGAAMATLLMNVLLGGRIQTLSHLCNPYY